MNREKIISLVKECNGFVYKDGDAVFDSTEDIISFYQLVRNVALEEAAEIAKQVGSNFDGRIENAILAMKETK